MNNEFKFVDSRTIDIIAAKKNFNVERERTLIAKALTTKCRCKHWTQTNPCFYHTCRHRVDYHYGLEKMSDLFTGEDAGYV